MKYKIKPSVKKQLIDLQEDDVFFGCFSEPDYILGFTMRQLIKVCQEFLERNEKRFGLDLTKGINGESMAKFLKDWAS